MASVQVLTPLALHQENVPPRNAASFLLNLYRMLESDSQHVHWFGNSQIVIPDPQKFSERVLPLYYKHSNFASFVRQLNLYGFQKVANLSSQNLPIGTWQFEHPFFLKDSPHLLPHIKRRNKPIKKNTLVKQETTTTTTTISHQHHHHHQQQQHSYHSQKAIVGARGVDVQVDELSEGDVQVDELSEGDDYDMEVSMPNTVVSPSSSSSTMTTPQLVFGPPPTPTTRKALLSSAQLKEMSYSPVTPSSPNSPSSSSSSSYSSSSPSSSSSSEMHRQLVKQRQNLEATRKQMEVQQLENAALHREYQQMQLQMAHEAERAQKVASLLQLLAERQGLLPSFSRPATSPTPGSSNSGSSKFTRLSSLDGFVMEEDVYNETKLEGAKLDDLFMM